MDARIKSGHDGSVFVGEVKERFAHTHTHTSQFSNSKTKPRRAFAASPREAPESLINLSPPGGRGECRVPAAPAASCALCSGRTHTSRSKPPGLAASSKNDMSFAMRSCGIAIIGLGLMGSSALYSLARRGADVLGFDPLLPGDARVSSHGSCRVYRRFNFESDAYTELSDKAFEEWQTLESATGHTILKPSHVLEAGPPGARMVAASRAAAARKGPVTGPTTGAEANAAFPAFTLPEHCDVVVQKSGGIRTAPSAIR